MIENSNVTPAVLKIDVAREWERRFNWKSTAQQKEGISSQEIV